MWSKPNIHITELPLSSPVEGDLHQTWPRNRRDLRIQLGEKLNIAAWKFYLLFARVKNWFSLVWSFGPGSLFFTDESNVSSGKQMHETCFSTSNAWIGSWRILAHRSFVPILTYWHIGLLTRNISKDLLLFLGNVKLLMNIPNSKLSHCQKGDGSLNVNTFGLFVFRRSQQHKSKSCQPRLVSK